MNTHQDINNINDINTNTAIDIVEHPSQLEMEDEEIKKDFIKEASAGQYVDEKRFHELSQMYSKHCNSPTFADWPRRSTHLIWSYVVDWVVTGILLGLLGVWFAAPRKWYFRVDDPDLSYPAIPETISAAAITLTIILGPILIVAIAQIWVRSFRDFHQSLLCTIQLFGSTQLICTFLWTFVGGLRPNFLALCEPDTSLEDPIVSPGGYAYYSTDICTCTQKQLYSAVHSFPSGHAASITAMVFFLCLYTSAKLRLYDNRSHFWKYIINLFLITFGLVVAFSRVRDGRHTNFHVCFGIFIGLLVAPTIYRLNYCSLFGPDCGIPTRYTWRTRWSKTAGSRKNMAPTDAVSGIDKEVLPTGFIPASAVGSTIPAHTAAGYPSS